MENYRNERSEYAQSESRTYSSEGRKLRPRKRITRTENTERRSERVSLSEGGNFERRSFRDNRDSSLGFRRSGGRSFGPRNSYNNGGSEQGEERRSSGTYSSQRREFGSDRRTRVENSRGGFGGDRKRSFSDNRGFAGNRGFSGDRRKSFENRGGNFSNDRKDGFYEEGTERRSNFRRGFGSNNYSDRKVDGRRGFGGRRQAPGSGNFRDRDRYSRGSNSNFRNRDFNFNETTEEGINQMINSGLSNANNNNFSDNDTIKPVIKDEVRLNKFMANSGVCSRREADDLILAGVVSVNGVVVTTLGTKVNIKTDDVRFNGQRLKGEEKVYILMNKPKGFVTSAKDPHADRLVFDLIKDCKTRVFSVGRLDKNTTGVLLLTNDGDLTEKLAHPSYDKKKIYQVSLDKALSIEDHDKIMAGIELHDGLIAADELEYIDANDHRKLGIKIHSGRNRIVRRIFEELGYDVRALDRVYFAGLTKKGLRKGDWRYLSEGEVNILKIGAYI